MVATGAQEAQTDMQAVALPQQHQAAVVAVQEQRALMVQLQAVAQVVTAEKRQVPIQ
jgi:hypothetical protein